MKTLNIVLILAVAALFVDATPAQAHDGAHRDGRHASDYGYHDRHYQKMPKRLKRNRSFVHWYRHTPLRYHRQIGWNALFDIYRWERRYFVERRYRHDDYRPERKRRNRHYYVD